MRGLFFLLCSMAECGTRPIILYDGHISEVQFALSLSLFLVSNHVGPSCKFLLYPRGGPFESVVAPLVLHSRVTPFINKHHLWWRKERSSKIHPRTNFTVHRWASFRCAHNVQPHCFVAKGIPTEHIVRSQASTCEGQGSDRITDIGVRPFRRPRSRER